MSRYFCRGVRLFNHSVTVRLLLSQLVLCRLTFTRASTHTFLQSAVARGRLGCQGESVNRRTLGHSKQAGNRQAGNRQTTATSVSWKFYQENSFKSTLIVKNLKLNSGVEHNLAIDYYCQVEPIWFMLNCWWANTIEQQKQMV